MKDKHGGTAPHRRRVEEILLSLAKVDLFGKRRFYRKNPSQTTEDSHADPG